MNNALSKSNSLVGIAATVLLIGGGIYIGIKNYKEPGFWWGVVALILIGSSIYIPRTT